MSSNAPDPAATATAASAPPATALPSAAPPKPKSKKKKATPAGGGGGGGGGATTPKPRPPRKKKSTPKPSAASRQALLQDAKQAQQDLQQHRALVASRKSDPLWYKIEDVLPAIHEANAMVGKTTVLPEQVQVIENALRQTGLRRSDLTPQAMACLLEQARRYALELLTDAQDYAHAAHSHSAMAQQQQQQPEISKADLLLAAEMRVDHEPLAVSTQLPKLNLVAAQVNRAPLPPIPNHCYSGVLLPPVEHQLTARTFDIVHASQVARKMVQEPPKVKNNNNKSGSGNNTAAGGSSNKGTGSGSGSGSAGAGGGGSSSAASYGASRGRQMIPIKLKDDTTAKVVAASAAASGSASASASAAATTTSSSLSATSGTGGGGTTTAGGSVTATAIGATTQSLSKPP